MTERANQLMPVRGQAHIDRLGAVTSVLPKTRNGPHQPVICAPGGGVPATLGDQRRAGGEVHQPQRVPATRYMVASWGRWFGLCPAQRSLPYSFSQALPGSCGVSDELAISALIAASSLSTWAFRPASSSSCSMSAV